jgi:hypothetical protein
MEGFVTTTCAVGNWVKNWNRKITVCVGMLPTKTRFDPDKKATIKTSLINGVPYLEPYKGPIMPTEIR